MLNTNEVPIFDSLAHPMPNGNWLHEKYNGLNTLELLKTQMAQNNIRWALAVGMGEGIGDYQLEKYASQIRVSADNIFPVAYVDVLQLTKLNKNELKNRMELIVSLGYVGVKLHPRFGKFLYDDPLVVEIITMAGEYDLAVLLCTYCWEVNKRATQNTPERLINLLRQVLDSKIVLVHGGAVRLLEHMEIARAFNNVLLDLSLTLCKYEGSSIDLDLQFLFRNFDQRICIGSDGPEFTAVDIRRRFNYFCHDLPMTKCENIAFRNLFSFIPRINV